MAQKKPKAKFWKGLVVMCGGQPIIIQRVAYDSEKGYDYLDYDGYWRYEDSLYRMTDSQAGFIKEKSHPGFPALHIYYKRDSRR